MPDTRNKEARRIIVVGRVQGVWFRDSTRREALALGLHGYAKNLDDGSVEVYACGPAKDLDALCEWLRRGPPLASVSGCEVSASDYQELQGFAVR